MIPQPSVEQQAIDLARGILYGGAEVWAIRDDTFEDMRCIAVVLLSLHERLAAAEAALKEIGDADVRTPGGLQVTTKPMEIARRYFSVHEAERSGA